MSILSGIFAKILLSREPKEDDSKTVVYPTSYKYIMKLCSAGFFLIFIFLLFLSIFFPHKMQGTQEFNIIMCILFFILTEIPCTILTAYLVKFKVLVKEDSFIYYNLFKKTKTYSYNNIYSTLIGSSYQFYINGKIVLRISLMFDNSSILHKQIKTYQKNIK